MAGIRNFGENYIQESIIKIRKMKKYKNIIWHYIGKIQSNKTKIISENFHWCQTVEQEKSAFLLNQYRPKNMPPMNILIQINISNEFKKNGICIEQYQSLVKKIVLMPNLIFRGIMAMPSQSDLSEYKNMQIIFNRLKTRYPSVDTLSLGTSLDIKQSLNADSNMIRIGRLLFQK